jgi:WD40 repeat protein
VEETLADDLDSFFVSGGTVPLESPSYVERTADVALLAALAAGKFCYVLNSRQMGKSSLCVRSMARLAKDGRRCAFVDLTKIGGRNVTPDQWYAGLTVEVGRALGLRAEMLHAWQEERDISPMQRFFSALRDVALERIDAPIVIFVDEIDATRSLPFSANEFFAGIRECYNRRVHDAAYKRLTFCLLGVAVPGDLIADPTTTPFNIGERVVLSDFTEEEAAPLAAGLGPGGRDVLRRILYWTNGHPFLTQSLAATAATRGDVHTSSDVDRVVAELLFQAKARETNINLADVGNRILNSYPDPAEMAKYRADVLSLYEKVVKGQDVFDDESNRLAAVLKLSGIVRVEDRKLKVRNRIYERVFDRHWVRENMPGAEIRRQRRAFIRGALRTGLAAAVVIAIIGTLAWNNARLADRAARERDRANYEVYVATMNLMRPTWDQNNLERLLDLLEATKSNPARGWEWDYWNRLAHLELSTLPKRTATTYNIRYSPTGKLYVREEGRIWEYSPDTGQLVDLMPMMGSAGGMLVPFDDGKRLLEYDGVQTAQVIDLSSRQRLTKLEDIQFWSGGTPTMISPDGRWVVGERPQDWQVSSSTYKSAVIWETETGRATSLPTAPVRTITVAPDGRMIATGEVDASDDKVVVRAVVREVGTWKVLASFETVDQTVVGLRFSPGSDRLAVSTTNGWIQLWDVKGRREVSRVRATGEGGIFYMEFSSDGTWLATSGIDRVGRLFAIQGSQMKLLATFRDAGALTIAPDSSRVAASYFTLRMYDPRTYIETPTAVSGVEGKFVGFNVLDRKTPAMARSADKIYELDPLRGTTQVLDWFSGKALLEPEAGESWGAIRRNDGTKEIVDFDTRRSVFALPMDTRTLGGVRQFPDNRRVILFYAGDKAFDVWDATGPRLLNTVRGANLLSAGKVSPDGRWFVGGYIGVALSVWDTATWSERSLSRSGASVREVTFSPDGSRFLAATFNDTIEVWDVGSGRLVGTLTGHSGSPEDAAYSPDGRRIVTAADDGTVRVWDAATLRELTSLDEGNRFVFRARFTDDGKSIVSIDFGGNARMWLTQTPPGLVAPAVNASTPRALTVK